MSLVEGPFPQVTFLGASVTSFGSSVGWNDQQSSVNVQLVEDPDKRQRFTRPEVGTPAKFVFEGFVFEGLIQRWLEKNAADGKPTFEVSLTDPREVLAGVQVIISSFRGEVNKVPNLLNAFGYWEDKLGFGGSLVNESGMVWNAPFEILNLSSGSQGGSIKITEAGPVGIMPAIHLMTHGGGGNFGGPVLFHGHTYKIDLSGLPLPPAYYRLGGVSASVLDMVSEICQDGGCDYICILNGNVISFKCVSRAHQPDPGQIASFINSRQDVATNNLGYELRNDVTNAIVIGGDFTELIQELNPGGGDNIWPYWGTDIDGNVIIGKGAPEDNHQFVLNASSVADIVGDVVYPCDIPELRCALIDFDSWAAYVLKWYNDKATTIGLVCAIDSSSDLTELFPNTLFQRDLIADNDEAAYQFGRMNESDFWTERAQRVYEFVRQYASEYFGKKFLVKIPFFIYWKFEPETTHRIASSEPTDAAYQPEGTMPLGLQFLNEGTFLSSDGRFQCFVKYTNADLADLSKLPPESVIIQGSDIYVRAQVDQEIGIVYPPQTLLPYCVVNVDAPVYEIATDPLGNINDIAQILDVDPDSIAYAAGLRHGSFPMKIHPSPYRPDAVALPIKSNRDSYGPWFTTGGVAGKVSFERDEGLVPWNYGGFDVMNQAAMAKLSNAATNMQYTETGTVEVAGAPDHSLGDELVAGGPQLTGIDTNIGTSGVTTTYRMQTFTPRFGQFTKNNADRLRRLGMAAQDMRRAVRALFQRQANINRIVASAQLGFMANASRAVRQQSPHDMLVASMTYDDNFGYRTQVSTQTPTEAVANSRADNPDLWVASAVMSLEGLLRPFSTNKDREFGDPASQMPHYESVDTKYQFARPEFDPFGDANDVDFISWGDEYPGRINTRKKDPDLHNSRLIGLRGPLVLCGWGYSYTGKPVPNLTMWNEDLRNQYSENTWSDSFADSHRTHPETWVAGPLGLYWDNWRKLWTIPTILLGTLDADMNGTSGTIMTITFKSSATTDKVKVFNYLGGDDQMKAGAKVVAAYNQQENNWWVIAAQCPTTS